MVGFAFCPRGWTEADGQLLDIASHSALFSLYGTIYGGDGRTTFALPDLRSRVPVHQGAGPGLSTYFQGERGGVESVALGESQMPAHTHAVPELSSPAGTDQGLVVRTGDGATSVSTSSTGGAEAHENRPPFLTIRFCIALEGVFPSRN
ncbi:MAG: tail fiber protein [Bacteroidota bacterium]